MLCMVNEPVPTAIWLSATILTAVYLDTSDTEKVVEVELSQKDFTHEGLLIKRLKASTHIIC